MGKSVFIPLITVMSEQGEQLGVVLHHNNSVEHELFVGFTSHAATFMYPLNKLLVLHVNGCGVVVAFHPDTRKAVISFDAATARQIVLAIADAKRTF